MNIELAFTRFSDAADAPREGFYSLERRHKVALPVRIWFGRPADPDNPGELLDRSPRWQMTVGHDQVPFEPIDKELCWSDVWPQCAKAPIAQSEHQYRLERITFAKSPEAAASDPWARRSGYINLLTAPIPE